MDNKLKKYLFNIYELTKRNMLIFFKNKTTIFFSLIAPVLILLIYILFMGDFQVDIIMDNIGSIDVTKKEISSIVNAWVISGIIGISTLTVALNSMFITISDREKGIVNDFHASPVNQVNLTLSYFISAVIITFFISLVFSIMGTIFLMISTGGLFSFNVLDIFKLLGLLLLSSLSAVIILMFITSFFKKTSTAASFTGIFTALIGFLVGTYLPAGFLPIGIQNFANIIPGTHSTALFRQLYLSKVISKPNIIDKVGIDFINQIKDEYGYNLKLFNFEITTGLMVLYLFISIVIFFLLQIIVSKFRNKHKI
ncbi:MAG TPA: ABC transporter permease [Haploplasma sp.]|nr:ABC transporter permease [Haploplasma sp.]